MRLTVLFLRARLTGLALAWFGAAALLAWVWLTRFDQMPLGPTLVTLPLLPAVVIGAASASPFGEIEDTASRPLPLFRVFHLASLTVLAAGLLVSAASAAAADDLRFALARTLVGFAGLALLGGRMFGSRVAWLAPLTYGAVVLYLDPASRWAWPRHLPVGGWSLLCAMLLVVAGLLAAGRPPSRDRPDEQ